MSGAFRMRCWRGAIGLIAAYALVLQAFLAYSLAAKAVAQDASAASEAFFVLCVSNDSAAASHDADAPAKPNTHCPICTLSSAGAGLLPDPVAMPIRQMALAQPPPSTAVCVSWHQVRVGLSRAPPLPA